MIRTVLILSLLIAFAIQAEAATKFLDGQFFAKYSKEFVTLLGKKSKSEGEISYKYPGKLILKQIVPDESQLVTNGETAWYYNAPFDPELEKGEVTISKAKDLPLTEILDSLQAGLKDGPSYTVKKNDLFVELLLVDKLVQRLEVKAVKLFFAKDMAQLFQHLEKLVLVKNNSSEEEYKFEKIDLKPKFGKDHFVFQIPEGTKINR